MVRYYCCLLCSNLYHCINVQLHKQTTNCSIIQGRYIVVGTTATSLKCALAGLLCAALDATVAEVPMAGYGMLLWLVAEVDAVSC